MNGRKYGHDYALKAHTTNLRAKLYPVSMFAPRKPWRLNEEMWCRHLERYKRLFGCKPCICGGVDELIHIGRRGTSLTRKINWGKTLGWWQQSENP